MVRRADTAAYQAPERFFREAVGSPANLRFSLPGMEVVGMVHPSARVDRSPAERRTIVLHGEILDDPPPDPGEALARAYHAGGAPALGRLHGSFAVLVLDAEAGAVQVVTDRWNTRRVFHSFEHGVEWFSTARSLKLHPLPDAELDPGGIAHLLVSQLPYNGRTPYRRLRVLAPASVHTVTREGVRTRRYRDLTITDRHAGRPEEELRGELLERIVAAVERRFDEPTTWLALSGGWDSRSILGAARALGVSDLRTLSFGEPGSGPGTDAGVAAAVASELGYPHRFVAGYGLDLQQALDANLPSRGTVQLVVEADAWWGVRDLLSQHDAPPPLLLGDHGVGCLADFSMQCRGDALASLKVHGMDAASWLRPLMPQAAHARMEEAVERDRADILARVPEGLGLEDTRYWLYMDQNLPRLLGYREFFAGLWSRPRYPLLDHDLVDFVAGLPTSARMDKSLLKRTVPKGFPTTFRREGARRGGPSPAAWLETRLQEGTREVRRQLREEPSPLDEWIPPGVLLEVLDGVREDRWSRRIALQRRLSRRARGSRVAARLLRPLGRVVAPTVPPSRLLVSALYLRTMLRRFDGASADERFSLSEWPRDDGEIPRAAAG